MQRIIACVEPTVNGTAHVIAGRLGKGEETHPFRAAAMIEESYLIYEAPGEKECTMEKRYPESRTFADLVSSWLPATEHRASWPSGIAGESSGGRRCSHSSAVEVARSRRLRSSPFSPSVPPSIWNMGSSSLWALAHYAATFVCRLCVRVKIRTGIDQEVDSNNSPGVFLGQSGASKNGRGRLLLAVALLFSGQPLSYQKS